MPGRDVEADLRQQLAESARTFVVLLRRGSVRTTEVAVNQIVAHAFGSPERLRDALDLLGEDETEPRALLTRAIRYAEDPRAPEPPHVRERRDASRYGGLGGAAPAAGGVTSGGGCYSGEDSRPTS